MHISFVLSRDTLSLCLRMHTVCPPPPPVDSLVFVLSLCTYHSCIYMPS